MDGLTRYLGFGLPEAYRAFLSVTDGAVLLAEYGLSASGLHLYGTDEAAGIQAKTERWRDTYGGLMDDLFVCGYTPGAGAFYLAIDKQGRVIDLFGYPDHAPQPNRPFPVFRGEWTVIAPDLDTLLRRMFATPADPFYWFANG